MEVHVLLFLLLNQMSFVWFLTWVLRVFVVDMKPNNSTIICLCDLYSNHLFHIPDVFLVLIIFAIFRGD